MDEVMGHPLFIVICPLLEHRTTTCPVKFQGRSSRPLAENHVEKTDAPRVHEIVRVVEEEDTP